MEYSHQEDHKSVLEEAQKLKEQGNTYFVAKDYDDAERYYTKAIELLLGLQIDQETGNEHEEEKRDESGEPSQHIHTTSEEIDKENKEDEKQEEISRVHPHQRERIATPQPKSSLKDRLPSDLHHPCSVYYANRAACHIAKEAWQAAIEDCSKSLELYPDYPKVLIRRAKAYEESNKLREALQGRLDWSRFWRIESLSRLHTSTRTGSLTASSSRGYGSPATTY